MKKLLLNMFLSLKISIKLKINDAKQKLYFFLIQGMLNTESVPVQCM